MTYWDILEEFIQKNEVIIDRTKGSMHPRYPNMVYPVDYGYISDTQSMDKGGIDIFIGEEKSKIINGVICIADRIKKDSEVKIIYECTEHEISSILSFLNKTDFMKGIFVERSNI